MLKNRPAVESGGFFAVQASMPQGRAAWVTGSPEL